MKEKQKYEYEQKRLMETINSRIQYEIKQIRSKSLDTELLSQTGASKQDKRRSWDETSLRPKQDVAVTPHASVQIDIESSDNEEIVPSEIRDVNYRAHDRNWEISMLADQWTTDQEEG